MKKILLDVDTGVDDSIAILYALFHPEVEVVGITTSCGNVDAMQAAENTLRLIELSQTKEDIPVVVGANAPLQGTWDGPVAFIHGDNGIGNVELPATTRKVMSDCKAEDFIYNMVCKYQHELTIVTLGRMTNLAIALEKYPDMKGMIKNVVAMGGTVDMRGNVTPVVEANFGGDPKACDMVFQAGLDLLVVGLDVTMRTRLTYNRVLEMSQYSSERCKPAVEYMLEALKHYMKGNRVQNYCINDCPLHDPLAMMVALNPSLVRTQRRKARIECEGTYCKGMVVTDLREQPFDAEFVEFAMEVDADRALNELMSVFWKK